MTVNLHNHVPPQNALLRRAEFVRDEMASFIENNFWLVLPYDLVRDLLLLRLTPLAVKDERDRRPRVRAAHRSG